MASIFSGDTVDKGRFPYRGEAVVLVEDRYAIESGCYENGLVIWPPTDIMNIKITRCVSGDWYENGIITVVSLAIRQEVFKAPKLEQ